jgi:dTDP-4-amino-4,6-dideoxy-D-galactose acyltransferase
MELCQYLPWDSDFFGIRIGRVLGHTLDHQQADLIQEWCQTNAISCLYFLADEGDSDTLQAAEKGGYNLVDIRITMDMLLQHKLVTEVSVTHPSGFLFRSIQPEDLPALLPVARQSYDMSRFYFDPCFPRTACSALFETWLTKSTSASLRREGEHVLVAVRDATPLGFLILRLDQPEPAETGGRPSGVFSLLGISPSARGLGLGRALVQNGMDWFHAHHASQLEIVTQGRNIASQRLFQAFGFRTQNVQLWYHKWFKDCAAPAE